jgi:adenine-specific DNA methylase
MKLTIAEMEAAQTGERIKIVNEYKVATGQPLMGNPPFGWMIAKDDSTGRKKVVKNPGQAPILNDLLDYYLTYQSKRKSITYLYSKYNITMSQHSFSALISNTLLYGFYRDNPNYCEAYIDKETFDRIQDISKRNIKENTADNRVYLFTGILKCPHCGRLLAGGAQKVKVKGHIYKRKMYRCPKHRSYNACDFSKSIFESTIEKMLLDNLEQYTQDARIRVSEIEEAKGRVPIHNIDEINKEIERLNYSWRKGRIKTIEQYDKDYEKLMERLEIAQCEQAQASTTDFEKITEVLQGDWRGIYDALTDENKRAFWRSIISSIEFEWTNKVKRIDRINFI